MVCQFRQCSFTQIQQCQNSSMDDTFHYHFLCTHLHQYTAIAVDLRYTDPFGCSIRADTLYKQVYVFIPACMTSLIPPCLMASFGLLTIYNVQKTRIALAASSRRSTPLYVPISSVVHHSIFLVCHFGSSISKKN